MKTRHIIVDFDGTLCDISSRLHFIKDKSQNGWDSFFADIPNDKPIKENIALVNELSKTFYVDIVTGRPDNYVEVSCRWLEKYGVKFDRIFMRQAGDRREDSIVKREIFDAHFKKEDVALVFEDRPSVVRMWRELGLIVADVGNGVDF